MADQDSTATLAAHTPGPWKFSRGEGCREIRGDKSGTHRQAQRRVIAFTVGLNDDAEDAANARLIAAAPDLLVACKELREMLAATCRAIAMSPEGNLIAQSLGREMKALGIESGYGVRAQQAIAKAEGRS